MYPSVPMYYGDGRSIAVITTVNSRGQVTIPASLRRKYGFNPGAKVVWTESNGQLVPIRLLSWAELPGRFREKPGERPLTEVLLEERRKEREREDRK